MGFGNGIDTRTFFLRVSIEIAFEIWGLIRLINSIIIGINFQNRGYK